MVDDPGNVGTEFEVLDVCWEDDDTIVYSGRGLHYPHPVLLRVAKARTPTAATLSRLSRHYRVGRYLPEELVVPPLALTRVCGSEALVLADVGARPAVPSISDTREKLSEILGLTLNAIRSIDSVHSSGVVHRNLTARNLWVDPIAGSVRLFDFSQAVVSGLGGIEEPVENAAGDVRYSSPELLLGGAKTVDYRSDYYSFGAILYEWLTGRPPFEGADLSGVIHGHLARVPTSPIEYGLEIPEEIGRIVLRLLEKNPSDRYQTASALRADILLCQDRLRNPAHISDRSAGASKMAESFRAPSRVYGRESETGMLLQCLERVRRSTTEIVLVTGVPGIGKSTLMRCLKEPVERQGGYFIAGRFDQYSKNIPYVSLVQAFQRLVSILLGQSDDRLATWRSRISAALGINGQIITELIPEVAFIVGPQPPLQALPPEETRNRFNLVFRDFVRAFGTHDEPLCILVDDLQWADAASLVLLETLMTDLDAHHIMFLGAYRSNEVDASHPLMLTLAALNRAGRQALTIELDGLSSSEVCQMVADASKCSKQKCLELATYAHLKTNGNPFFLTELFRFLGSENLVAYDRGLGEWHWDIREIWMRGAAGDVVEMLRTKLLGLPADTQRSLMTAACLGSAFNIKRLSAASGLTLDSVQQALQLGVTHGLIAPQSSHLVDSEKGAMFQFIHDRVQQAAFSLIPVHDLDLFRLDIGRRLLSTRSETDSYGEMFEIVSNLNFGLKFITAAQERDKVARLNLEAGRIARTSLAHHDALTHFQTGIALLNEGSWQDRYGLTFDLYAECFECEYQVGNFEQANALFELLLHNARSVLDRARIYYTKILLDTSSQRYAEAIQLGIEGLQLFGIRFPAKPSKRHLLYELIKAKAFMFRRRVSDLLDLQSMTNPELVAASRILVAIYPAAYFLYPDTLMLAGLKIVTMSMKYGNAPVSAGGYVLYGLALGAALGDIPSGHDFGELAVQLADRNGEIGTRCRTLVIHGGFVNFWRRPIESSLKILREGYAVALDAGDFQYANYAVLQLIFLRFARGERLSLVANECERFRSFVLKTKDPFAVDNIRNWQQAVRALMGQTEAGTSLSSSEFCEVEAEQRYRANANLTTLGYFLIRKLQLAYLFWDFEAALRYGQEAEQFVTLLPGQILLAEHALYFGLTLVAVAKAQSESVGPTITALKRCRRRLRHWAQHAPMNFEPMYLLLTAEIESLDGSNYQSLTLYDKAIESALEGGFFHIESLAAERAALHYLRKRHSRIAQGYLLEAIRAYGSWEAIAKVRQLEKWAAATGLLLPSVIADSAGADVTVGGDAARSGALDLKALCKTSQIIAGEYSLQDLLRELMVVALEVGGAQRGVIILREGGSLKVRLVGEGQSATDVIDSEVVDDGLHASPSVVNFVARTGRDIIIEDASTDSVFASCPYVRKRQPRALLCLAMKKQGQTIGVLYLENNLLPGGLAENRLTTLSAISAEMAIAIENARIYGSLRQSRELLQDAVHKAEVLDLVKSHLEKFVPSSVQRLISQNPDSPDLEMRNRDISVVFLDIAGYVALSERFEKTTVSRFVERYFSSFLNDIHRNSGDICQTAGDGLMLIFQEPEVNAHQAVTTALAIQRITSEINGELAESFSPIAVNIGINSGVAWVGSTKLEGATGRLWTYTAVGPVANLASRIGTFAKRGAILISRETMERVKDRFEITALGAHEFKNVSALVEVFRVDREKDIEGSRAPL